MKTRRLNVRIAPADRERLLQGATADDLPLSTWLVRAGLAAAARAPLLTLEDRTVLVELSEQLRMLGINLNQVARALNALDAGGTRGRLPDADEFNGLLRAIAATHRQIRDRLDGPQ